MRRFALPTTLVTDLYVSGFFILWFNAFQALGDSDVPWHIRAGELILRTHGLPATDPFSYTANGYPWFNLSWLFDIVLAKVWAFGGANSLFLLSAFSLMLLIPLIGRLCRNAGADMPCIMFACWACACILGYGAQARPSLVTIWMCLIFYAVLRHERSATQSRVPPWVLPVLMVLWTNLHGGFVAAFTILGAFGAEYALSRDVVRLKRLVWQTIGVALATLVNPYGVFVYEGIWRSINGELSRTMIAEWTPLNAQKQPLFLCFLLLLLVPGRFLDRRNAFSDQLLILFWSVQGFLALRNLTILAIFAAPFMARNLSLMLRESPFAARYVRYAEEFACDKDTFRMRFYSLLAAGVITLIVLIPPLRSAMWINHDWENSHDIPYQEIAWLHANHSGQHFVADLYMAGLAMMVEPNHPALYMDGRDETAYPPSVVNDYMDYYKHTLHPDELLRKYGASGFLIANGNRVDLAYLTKIFGYRIVFQGPAATVLMPQSSKSGL